MILLNVSENAYSKSGNQATRYHNTMASTAEVRSIYDLVEGFGWIERNEARHARLSHIIGTLVRVLKLKR